MAESTCLQAVECNLQSQVTGTVCFDKSQLCRAVAMPSSPSLPVPAHLHPPQADLAENKAKKVHPELRKFQMEKQARCGHVCGCGLGWVGWWVGGWFFLWDFVKLVKGMSTTYA